MKRTPFFPPIPPSFLLLPHFFPSLPYLPLFPSFSFLFSFPPRRYAFSTSPSFSFFLFLVCCLPRSGREREDGDIETWISLSPFY